MLLGEKVAKDWEPLCTDWVRLPADHQIVQKQVEREHDRNMANTPSPPGKHAARTSSDSDISISKDGSDHAAAKNSNGMQLDDDAEMRRLANEHLRNLKQHHANASSGGDDRRVSVFEEGMVKSTSTEILSQYNMQPIHVRSRAEQWELARSEIQLTTKLGEGDGGVIYHAHWRGLDVVAKMLKTESDQPSAINAAVAKADLINEISMLSRLRHPNLVMFLGACTVKEPLIILNEYCSGGNLEDYLLQKRKGGRSSKPWIPPPKQVLSWSMELSRALCFLHNCNPVIIHRDLKPANLLLNEDGHLKVGDFGLSKVKDIQKIAGTYRMTGKTGSMRYMAPEVFLDDPHYDEKVDIYSTGLIMWYMTLGERPFDRVPAHLVAEKASSGSLRPNIDPVKAVAGLRFAGLMERCWDSESTLRPSASELVDELEALTKEFKEKVSKGKCCVM